MKTYRHNSDHRQSTTPKNDAIPGPTLEKGGVGEGRLRQSLGIEILLTYNYTSQEWAAPSPLSLIE